MGRRRDAVPRCRFTRKSERREGEINRLLISGRNSMIFWNNACYSLKMESNRILPWYDILNETFHLSIPSPSFHLRPSWPDYLHPTILHALSSKSFVPLPPIINSKFILHFRRNLQTTKIRINSHLSPPREFLIFSILGFYGTSYSPPKVCA